MGTPPTYDLIVIGSGPGGYVCALRAAQLGLKAALIEKDPFLGGTCLNIGCIPSKALLHSTELYHQALEGKAHGLVFDNLRPDLGSLMKRKESVVLQLRKGVETLVQKRGIDVYEGLGRLTSPTGVEVVQDKEAPQALTARNIVLATGSVPMSLPFLEVDEEAIVSSTGALAFEQIPKSMVVIGAGAIGLEMGSVWSRLGTKVTVAEFLPTIAAGSDPDVSRLAERIFKKQGMTFKTKTRVTGCEKTDAGLRLTAEAKGKEIILEAEKVLLSIGRQPYSKGLGLDTVGLETDERGRLPVDNYRTAVPSIWAIGDLIPGPMLAHKAEEDGVAVAEAIAGKPVHMPDPLRVPNVIYTEPEIASIGLTETAAKESGLEIKTGTFNLMANGRAIAQDATSGMAKIIADKQSDRILGAAIIASGASEMIASVAAHMEYGGSAEDLAGTIHAHPTISESLKEAALAVDGRAIHSL
jgi:dihydrolipoamide dehydrogenase